MTTWYFVRHAEKELGNYLNPILRHQDEPITRKGLVESDKLLQFFSDKQISHIYISAYQRTGQTIAVTARALNLVPVIDSRLNEIDNGRIEGLTDDEIHQAFPDVWKGFRERNSDFRFPDGETGEEVRERLGQFIKEKLQQRSKENLIAVAHDGLIRILMCHILNLPVYRRWNFRVDFCGVTEIEYQSKYDDWKLIRFNHTLS